MAVFCTNCGKEIPDGVAFCTECGAKAGAAAPVQEAPTPPPAPRPATASASASRQNAPTPNFTSPGVSGDKTVSTGYYFGMMLLYAIPVIGWIVCIIVSATAKNKSKKNHAKAMLIWLIIGIVLSIIGFFIGRAAIGSAQDYIERSGISAMEGVNGSESGELGALMGLLGGSSDKAASSGKSNGLLGLLGGLTGSGKITNKDIEDLEDLRDSLKGVSGIDQDDLNETIDKAQDINREMEAKNSGWPKSLRTYPGGTATSVTSYRTEITGTTEEEMMAWIEDLKADGFAYQDFYDFGMSESDMLSIDGWWATDGEIYLSLAFSDGKLTVDHTKELPDISGLF